MVQIVLLDHGTIKRHAEDCVISLMIEWKSIELLRTTLLPAEAGLIWMFERVNFNAMQCQYWVAAILAEPS